MNDLAGFRYWLLQRGRKPSTVRLHSQLILRVAREARSLEYNDVISYLTKLKEKGAKNSYLNFFVTALRSWADYTHDEKLQHLRKFKVEDYERATMSDEEIEQFLSLPCPTFIGTNWNTGKKFTRPTDPKGWERMTMFWTICAFSGMRMGEVSHLKVENVDFGRQIFSIDEGKTGHRIVPIAPNIQGKLKNYIGLLKGDSLFPGRRKAGVIDETDWGYSFTKRVSLMGLRRKHLTPYSFRHSYCTRMLESDINLFTAQKIMGHKRLETTQIYSHLTTKDMIDAIKKLPLIRKTTDPCNILQHIAGIIKGLQLHLDPRFSYDFKETENEIMFKVKIK